MPVAVGVGADGALEVGWCAELQGGAQHGRVAAAEVGDGVDLGPGVQHRLQEGIPPELPGH